MIKPKSYVFINGNRWYSWQFPEVFDGIKSSCEGCQTHNLPESPAVDAAKLGETTDPMSIVNVLAGKGITCKPIQLTTGQCFETFDKVNIYAGYAKKKMLEAPETFFPMMRMDPMCVEIQYSWFRNILIMVFNKPIIADATDIFVIFMPTEINDGNDGEIRMDLQILKEPVYMFDMREHTAAYTLNILSRQRHLGMKALDTGGCDIIEIEIPTMLYWDVAVPKINMFRNMPVSNQIDYLFRIGVTYFHADPCVMTLSGTGNGFWKSLPGIGEYVAPGNNKTVRTADWKNWSLILRDQIIRILAMWETDDLPILNIAEGYSISTRDKLDWIFTYLIQAVCYGVGGLFGKYNADGWEPCMPCSRLKQMLKTWLLKQYPHTEILGTQFSVTVVTDFRSRSAAMALADDEGALLVERKPGAELKGHFRDAMTRKDFRAWLKLNKDALTLPDPGQPRDIKTVLVNYFTGKTEFDSVVDLCIDQAVRVLNTITERTKNVLETM